MEAELGRPCRHFAYPYGDPGSAGERDYRLTAEAGFASAVTTRRGLIKAKHKDVPTGLPRLSLNGDYQDVRYLDALLTGLPFAMLDAAAGAARLARR
jgi:peptidoglycan/xylan/chitin deacetylase (PgdA/CDA1 family)